jgi:hypothetical protein
MVFPRIVFWKTTNAHFPIVLLRGQMKKLPIEKQVCALEQAKKLAELLGDDAPESVWVWVNHDESLYNDPLAWSVYVRYEVEDNDRCYFCIDDYIAAYTGDELVVLLDIHCLRKGIMMPLSAEAKANLAIAGLTKGWIKKEKFQYE